jgi:hypothetical protein
MTWKSEIDPSKWDEKKIQLYRASLHRHHDSAIEQEKDLGRTAVGLMSVIAVVWSIIGVYATTKLVHYFTRSNIMRCLFRYYSHVR